MRDYEYIGRAHIWGSGDRWFANVYERQDTVVGPFLTKWEAAEHAEAVYLMVERAAREEGRTT